MGQEAVGVEPTNLLVFCKAVRLESTRQLADYGIDDGAAVHLVRRKRGYMYLTTHSTVLEVTAIRGQFPLGSRLGPAADWWHVDLHACSRARQAACAHERARTSMHARTHAHTHARMHTRTHVHDCTYTT